MWILRAFLAVALVSALAPAALAARPATPASVVRTYYTSTDPAVCSLLTVHALLESIPPVLRGEGETALDACRRLVRTVLLGNVRVTKVTQKGNTARVTVSYTFRKGVVKKYIGCRGTDTVVVVRRTGQWRINSLKPSEPKC